MNDVLIPLFEFVGKYILTAAVVLTAWYYLLNRMMITIFSREPLFSPDNGFRLIGWLSSVFVTGCCFMLIASLLSSNLLGSILCSTAVVLITKFARYNFRRMSTFETAEQYFKRISTNQADDDKSWEP